MPGEVAQSRTAGPASSTAAIAAAAAAAILVFWLTGEIVPWEGEVRVAFLLATFGVMLVLAVAYSWAMDRVWRRATDAAHSDLMTFKGDFVGDISHELRTTLTGIVGFAQLVDARVLGGDNAEAINAVVSQSVELSRVVDDMVARTRIDAGNLTVETRPVPVVEEVATAVSFVEVMGAEVAIRCEEAHVLVDPDAFRHVLRNLLVNAHRHGRPPLGVRGRVFGDQYICQVVDGGAGVAPEAERQMFGESRPGAAGLGLAVARDLAGRMGAMLSYRHIRGETHFVLTVPLARSPEKAEPVWKPIGVEVPRPRRDPHRRLEGATNADR